MITRLYEYLNKSRGVVATDEEVAAVKAMHGDSPSRLYRGLRTLHDEGAFIVVDPKAHQRRSKENKDYYTLWIDNHPNWSAYPKRSQSLICSTSFSSAATYATGGVTATPFKVWPMEKDAKFAVCPANDIWSSMVQLYYGNDTFKSLHTGVYKKFKAPDVLQRQFDDNPWFTDADGYKYMVCGAYEVVKMLALSKVSDDSYESMVYDLKSMDLYDFVEMVFVTDGFKMLDFEGLLSVADDKLEVWTDAKCMLTKNKLA